MDEDVMRLKGQMVAVTAALIALTMYSGVAEDVADIIERAEPLGDELLSATTATDDSICRHSETGRTVATEAASTMECATAVTISASESRRVLTPRSGILTPRSGHYRGVTMLA
jgi:phage/plasmid primase-like uncharacterized protein